MGTYHAKGSGTFNGVSFRILADNIEEARKKAKEGDFHDFEIDAAEIVDWEIKVATVEP